MTLTATLAQLWQGIRLRLAVYPLRFLVKIALLFSKSANEFPYRTLSIASADNKRRIKVLLYEPPGGVAEAPKPVHVTFHGSGFVLPLLGTNGRFCTKLARELGCIVVDGDYIKAPEYPFPAGYEDAMQVVKWVLANVNGDFDTTRVSIGGFSAGANLALAVCGQLPPGKIKGVVALYPSTDFSIAYVDKQHPPPGKAEAGSAMSPGLGTFFRECYLPAGQDMNDPRLSPCKTDMNKFPGNGRTLIVTCEYDRLDKEGQTFKDLLANAGKEPEYMWMDKLGHGWDSQVKEGTWAATRREDAYAKAVEVLRKAYATD